MLSSTKLRRSILSQHSLSLSLNSVFLKLFKFYFINLPKFEAKIMSRSFRKLESETKNLSPASVNIYLPSICNSLIDFGNFGTLAQRFCRAYFSSFRIEEVQKPNLLLSLSMPYLIINLGRDNLWRRFFSSF